MNIVANWSDISRSSIRSKLENKKNILQFLPESLLEISKLKNFTYKNQKLKVSYLIDIVHSLILKYYFKRDNKFSLSSVILKEKYGYLYNFYINFLLEKKTILMLSNYKAGTRSRVYSLNESILHGKIFRYLNLDKTLLKKYKNKISQVEEGGIENILIDNDIKSKLIDDLFYIQIQFDRSIFYLDTLKNDDNDIYHRNRYSVECINDKHIFYHFDSYGRLHTNFTILKSFLRKNCLTIDGCETTEIDIKNSQPLFLSKLINDSRSKWVNSEELNLFKYLTMNGKYYQYLMTELNINRPDAKELTYKVLFGRNGKNSKSDKMFSRLFPTIHSFIKLYKIEMGDYRVLAYDLQKAESNLIFNKIIRQVITLYPQIKLVTVHDSIIVPNKWKEEVSAIFYSKLYEEFGLI
jgi:hypothetical protein